MSAPTTRPPTRADATGPGRPSRGTHDDPLTGLPLLLAVPEAAKLLGISRAAAYRLTASGELPSRRLGGRVYVITTALRALVELG